MGLLKKSHREMDYIRVSSRKKALYYSLKRGHISGQIIDRMKWHWASKLFIVADFPTHLDIEASSSCQMRCPMCLRRAIPNQKSGAMDFRLYTKIVDECAQRGVYSIKLSWRGEPLLNPNIIKMVRYAKEKEIKDVAFLTNGERLSENMAKDLIKAGLDWISFSIDGLEETYERIRWPETFGGITRKVKFLKDYRDKNGLKKPLIRVQTIWGAVKNNPGEYFEFWEKLADKVYIIADQLRYEIAPFPKNPNYMCAEPWRRVVIGSNGIVPQCITDYDELNPLGDVKKQTIYEIWHGEKFNKLRESIKNGKLFNNKPCARCHDTGLMYPKIVKIGDRRLKIWLYRGQEIDVSKMDARPKRRKS